MRRWWLLAGIATLFIGLAWGSYGWLLRGREPQSQVLNPVGELVEMTVGGNQLMVEIRDDEKERALGLSYRESLPPNQGMVFVFASPGRYGFWMKGMRFPLDMIWVRAGKVVDISTMVPNPLNDEAVPVTRTPRSEVDMVIEVNGGWVRERQVEIGGTVVFSRAH